MHNCVLALNSHPFGLLRLSGPCSLCRMEQPRPKKRRRRRKKDTQDSAIGTFSISVDAARDDDAGGALESSAVASSVRSRAEALGGTYSATVHRNVHVLLASAGAVERKTQRVRKAAKLGVAIVDAAPFLDACEAGAFDADAHALRVADADADGGGGKAVDLNDDACWVGSSKYDGGCSCACHDVPGAPPFCEWCEDGAARQAGVRTPRVVRRLLQQHLPCFQPPADVVDLGKVERPAQV